MLDGRGRCLCGAVRYKFDPKALIWQAHCHCESCRRACSAPMATFFSVRDTAWRWSGQAPAVYASSPGVERFFCRACGSPMGYRSKKAPGEMHGLSASLEEPSQATPERHDFWNEKLAWLHIVDDLPKDSR